MPHLVALVFYICFGPLFWIAYSLLVSAGHRRLLLLKKIPKPLPDGVSPPHVTMLVPAKNEGGFIRECLTSCLTQDYPHYDIIAINDRSTDDTGRVMDEMAAADTRLRVLHIPDEPLPGGWTGKTNALYHAQKQATGEWLLFVDSDVIVKPTAITAAMSCVLNKRFDMVSLLPELENHGLWENMMVPLAAAALMSMYKAALANVDHQKNVGFANGQFILISRAAYDGIGGHARVKHRLLEDVALASALKANGFRPRISIGNDWLRARMYNSPSSMFRGWARIFYAAGDGRPGRIIIASLVLILCCFTPPLAILQAVAHRGDASLAAMWLAAVGVHVGAMALTIGRLFAWTGNRWWWALLFPLAGPALLYILCRAAWMCVTKKVVWRGATYQQPARATSETSA